MVLISIVIGLVLEKYCDMGKVLSRFTWFPAYLRTCQPILAPCARLTPFLAVALAVLLPVIIIGLLYWMVCGWLFGVVGLLFNIIILIYCLGPATLHSQWQAYLNTKQTHDATTASAAMADLSSDLPEYTPDETTALPSLSQHLLLQAYCRLFAVLFWFTVFGWVGALVYRLIAQSRTATLDDPLDGIARASACIQAGLDWIPTRVFALILMLVGTFGPAFGVWCRHLISGLERSYAIIINTASAALSLPATSTHDDVLAGKETALLIERSLIVWVVAVALLTIGRLIG